MKSSAVVLLIGALWAAGAGVAATRAQEADDPNQSQPAKLVRKGAPAAADVRNDAERRPADPVRTGDDASPPVLFEEEPGHDHDHAAGELDEDLLDLVKQLLEGEGDGGAEDEQQHPLLRIGRRMRDVEARIAEVDAGRETQTIQTSIVEDLDALIDQLKQQASSCSNCNGAGCAQCQQLGSKRGQRPGKPNNSGRPGNNPRANTAATQAGKTTPQQVAAQRRADLLKNVWGHLPLRMREKLEQMSEEVFLPQYEVLIERYFEALLERTDRPTN